MWRRGAAAERGAAFRDNWESDPSGPFPPPSPAFACWRTVFAGTRARRVERLCGGLCRVEEGNSELWEAGGGEGVKQGLPRTRLLGGKKLKCRPKGRSSLKRGWSLQESRSPNCS